MVMRAEVRDLYKRFLLCADSYPPGRAVLLDKVKSGFRANAALTEEVAIKKAIAQGRYWAREICAVNRLHKYRSLRKRYYTQGEQEQEQDEGKKG